MNKETLIKPIFVLYAVSLTVWLNEQSWKEAFKLNVSLEFLHNHQRDTKVLLWIFARSQTENLLITSGQRNDEKPFLIKVAFRLKVTWIQFNGVSYSSTKRFENLPMQINDNAQISLVMVGSNPGICHYSRRCHDEWWPFC